MEKIRLLIVDDVEDNRLVLRAICRKIEGFEIFDAVDGQDGVEKCEEIRPHIVLMDVMMPRMDGFTAAKIIKSRYPETIVMAVTAVIDPKMEENMAAIGVSAYIRKPIDKDLIRLKLQSYASTIHPEGRETKLADGKKSLNPFGAEIRNFKIVFEIDTPDAVMDFGVWLLGRFECAKKSGCTKVDTILELLYELIYKEVKAGESTVLTVEESFDELFFTIPLSEPIELTDKKEHLIHELGAGCIVQAKRIAFRLPLRDIEPAAPKIVHTQPAAEPVESIRAIDEVVKPLSKAEEVESPIMPLPIEEPVETRQIGVMERQVLRESFVNKVTALEYVETIDADAYGEVADLREAEQEWVGWLETLVHDGREANLIRFADDVLGAYANAIGALFEFSGLAYALTSLATMIKNNAAVLQEDEQKRSSMLMFLEFFKNDLSAWIEHVFEKKDALDIHYLDASFFSSCMQIESVISGVQVDHGEENDIEFF